MHGRDERHLFRSLDQCEEQFRNWLLKKLSKQGCIVHDNQSFRDLLKTYEHYVNSDHQHINPLLNWMKENQRCQNMKTIYLTQHQLTRDDLYLLEKTALNGAVLWLTFQDN